MRRASFARRRLGTDCIMVSKHGRGRWRKSSAEGPLALIAPLLPARVAAALRSPRAAVVTLALVALGDVALAFALFAELHNYRFDHGAPFYDAALHARPDYEALEYRESLTRVAFPCLTPRLWARVRGVTACIQRWR